jgi:hypothetical protein
MSASCSASNCPNLARNNADWYAARCLRLIDSTFIGDAGSHRCSMTAAAPVSRYNERRPSCMSLRAAFATRPRAASCVAAFPSASSGVEEDVTPGRSLAHSPHRRFAFACRPESACGSVSSAARLSHHVRHGRKKGLWLKLNCHNPTSSTKPRKQGCSMKQDPSIL